MLQALDDLYTSIINEQNMTTTDATLKSMLVRMATETWDMQDPYSFRLLDGVNEKISSGRGRSDCGDEEAVYVLDVMVHQTMAELDLV